MFSSEEQNNRISFFGGSWRKKRIAFLVFLDSHAHFNVGLWLVQKGKLLLFTLLLNAQKVGDKVK